MSAGHSATGSELQGNLATLCALRAPSPTTMGSTGWFRCPLCGRWSDCGYALDWVGYPVCSVCNFRQTSDPGLSVYYHNNPNRRPVTERVAPLMSPSGGLADNDTITGIRQRQLQTIVNDGTCRLSYVLSNYSLLALIASLISQGDGIHTAESMEINFLEDHDPNPSAL